MNGVVAAILAGLARLLGGGEVRWRGGPPAPGPRVYFANHASHLDFAVIWAVLPADLRGRTRPVAARDYWERGRVRRYLALRVFRAVLVDRGGERIGDLKAQFDRMTEALDAGDALILFPEGTRGGGGELAPFQSGLYHLARRRPETDLVPVHLRNLHRVLPKGELLPVPLLGRVSVGAPLRLEAGEGKEAFLARARAALEALAAP